MTRTRTRINAQVAAVLANQVTCARYEFHIALAACDHRHDRYRESILTLADARSKRDALIAHALDMGVEIPDEEPS